MSKKTRRLPAVIVGIGLGTIVVAISTCYTLHYDPMRGKWLGTAIRIGQIEAGIHAYAHRFGHFPCEDTWREDLRTLGFPSEPEYFRDLWGQELIYTVRKESEGVSWLVHSVGPNGIDEGGWGDDVIASTHDDQRRPGRFP